MVKFRKNEEISNISSSVKYSSKEKLVRINAIIGSDGVLPLSAATWWSGVKKGYYPKPIKLGPNITAWRMSDIDALIENGFNHEGGGNE